ncbi:MAG: UvrD-helicase domain-containing protein [Desulfobacterota bacterium]|nr:UvrD-helicase domain-containing protein [Thermodesulfobacteriota bacterium]
MREGVELIDHEARGLATGNLDESYLVEASAGTGKTTLLVHRILNLLRGGRADLDEVVAITFTEKAAAELKVKLRYGLEQVLLEGLSPEEARRLSKAISDLERMQVTTIHSFCASMLRERPVEAGIDPNFEVADELTSSLLQADVWERWLEKEMSQRNPALHLALLYGIGLDQMRSIGQFLLKNEERLTCLPSPPSPEEVGRAIDRFTRSFEEGMASLDRLMQFCKDREGDRAAQRIGKLNEQFRAFLSLPEEERGIFLFKKLAIGSSSRLGNQGKWHSRSHLEDVRVQIERLSDAHEELKAFLADSVLTGLAQVLTQYVRAYGEAKKERNLLDFDDLLRTARKMLQDHPQVRRFFRERYKYLFVDEFQDTDPLQVEIAFFLSEEEGSEAAEWREIQVAPGRLFLVGDPKQSIYRFRRADIEIYEEARSRMGGGRLLTISQNFRCAPSIVDVVNRVFADLIQLPADGHYQPPYVPLHFGRKPETVPPVHGTVLLYPPKAEEISFAGADEVRLHEARCIASFIRRSVEEERWQIWDEADRRLRPLEFRDIAILLRTSLPLPFLEEALREFEVPYRALGGRQFYLRQEVQQLLALLRAVDHPNDTVSLLAALRSPFFGISDEEIFLFNARGGVLDYLHDGAGTPLEEPFALLKELHEMRNRVSVSALLKRLFEASRGLVLFLLKPQGEQRVANLLKIGELARALGERGVFSFGGFVRWLSDRQEEEAEEEEPPSLERGDDFVRLLTIHKAKGLEFPVVILADLAHQSDRKEEFIIDRLAGKIAFKVGRSEAGLRTRDYEALKERERRRAEAEEKRLLYVGMTRARDFLVLPVFWVGEKKDGRKEIPNQSFLAYLRPHLPDPERISFGQWESGMMVYDTRKLDLFPKERGPFRHPLYPDPGDEGEVRLALSRFERWKIEQEKIAELGAKGRAIGTAIEMVEEYERDEEEIALYGGGEGALFGKLVHRLMERLDWVHPDGIGEMAEAEGRRMGASGEMIQRAGEMVRRAIESEVIQRVLKSQGFYKEVPFSFKKGETLFEGVMDLLFREGDDLVVLDFKTDLVNPEGLDSKVDHYRPQVEVYAEAVQRIFGRPPKEVILFFLHPMVPFSLAPEGIVRPPGPGGFDGG